MNNYDTESFSIPSKEYNSSQKHGNKMRTVKVKTTDLLKKLKENRTEHTNAYTKAHALYRERALKELKKLVSDAENGKIRLSISLSEPTNQIKEYDRIIMMMEMSTDTIVEISEQEFSMYVMDEWNWKQQFMHTNSFYLGR